MDALRTTKSSSQGKLSHRTKESLFAIGTAIVSVGIGAIAGAVGCGVGMFFGSTFLGAWNNYGFVVGCIVAPVSFIVIVMATYMADVMMTDEEPHLDV